MFAGGLLSKVCSPAGNISEVSPILRTCSKEEKSMMCSPQHWTSRYDSRITQATFQKRATHI